MRSLSVLLAVLLVASCSSRSGNSSPTRQRDTITREEIASLQVSSVYEVVQQLRPEYLRSRGMRSMASSQAETAQVYVDGVRQGGVQAMRNIPKETVEEIRYMNASDATTLYGTGHAGGAILIRTRR